MASITLDPNRKEHKTIIEKIDALLVHVVGMTAEASLEICEKVANLSEDKQEEVLKFLMGEVGKLTEKRKEAIVQIKQLQKKAVAEIEGEEKKEADVILEQDLHIL